MNKPVSPVNDDAVLRAIISHFLNFGARASDDARWFVGILSVDLLGFFRAEVIAAIREKAGDPMKARKIFLSMGKTAKAIFGPEYLNMRKTLNNQARLVRRKIE